MKHWGLKYSANKLLNRAWMACLYTSGKTYKLYGFLMLDHLLLLAEPKQTEGISILQTEKHFDLLKNSFGRKVVLLLHETTAFNRKRLIEKGINFIIPNSGWRINKRRLR